MKRILITIILLALLCLAMPASATDYYVSEGGGNNSGVATCGDGMDGSAEHRTLTWANANMVAGDTCVLCNDGGTFTTWVIDPTNSGTSGSPITYQGESGVTVTIDATNPDASVSHGSPIDLRDGQDYITAKDLTLIHADNTDDCSIYIYNSNNIIIDNIIASLGNTVAKSHLFSIENSEYIEYLNSDLTVDHTTNVYHDMVTVINSEHLLFYNVSFHEVAHDNLAISAAGSYCTNIVVKNCTFDNKWRSGMTEHANAGFVLVDNCAFKNIGSDNANNPYLASAGDPGSTLRGGGNVNHTIWRYNNIYKSYAGMRLYSSTQTDDSGFYIYQNTVANIYDGPSEWTEGLLFLAIYDDVADIKNNNILNNIFAFTNITSVDHMAFGHITVQDNVIENNTWYDDSIVNIRWDNENNTVAWQDANNLDGWANNLASNPNMTDYINDSFTLQTGSPAIDAARYLTLVNDSSGGSGTSLVVDDAKFFFSEETWDIPDSGDNIQSDTIYVDNPSSADFSVLLTTIDYDNSTMTLSSSKTWDDNAEVYLCPDGVCFSGSAPDMGAYETAGSVPNITSWANNDTNDDTLSITVDALQQVNFNATADQTITTWTWKKDNVDQSHNHANITLNWSSLGSKSVTVTAANTNGISSAVEWSVTVEQIGTFNYYKEILINHSMVYEDLTNFSVLINFTDSDLADHAQADGDDIIFRASDKTTQLDHEQEYWNKTTGDYVGWVRVPAVNSTVNTTIYMYYNNSDAVNSEDAAGVWDAHYKAVYHMSETPPGTIYDSTSNDNDGTTSGMDSADQVTGEIDGALDFDEVNDYVYTGVDSSLDVGNNITITIYAERHDAVLTGLQSLVVYREANTDSQYTFYYNADERLEFWIHNGSWQGFTGTTQVQDTNPRRVDLVWNGTYAWTYIDGAQDNAGAFAHTPANAAETLWIGNDSAVSNREFDGILDECRISDTPRSAGWISTGYNTTKYPELFLIFGSEESEGNNIVLAANKYGMLRKNVSSAEMFSTIAAGFSHDVCYTWWNSTGDVWESYWVGDSYNSAKTVPQNNSYFVLMDGTGETVSCSTASAGTVAIPSGWSMTYLRESGSKTLTAIKSDMGGNCADLYAWNPTASGTGTWTDTGAYSVLPNQGLLVNASTGFNWDGAVP